jgi:hypothetical protein
METSTAEVTRSTSGRDGRLPADRVGAALLQAQRHYGNRYTQALVEAAMPGSVARALPVALRREVERLAGVGMEGVRVHHDSALPARLGAAAYTRGSDIFLAPGQERHLAHEAWHVAQQSQGRVRRRVDVDGILVDDSPALEREADTMARQICTAGPGPEGPVPPAPSQSGAPVVQRVVSIGTQVLPPSDQLPAEYQQYLEKNRLVERFKQLNDERERVYIFYSQQHLDAYLNKLADPKLPPVDKPLVSTLPPEQLEQAHRYRQDLRFARIMAPSPNQIPQHGHGAHAIPMPMLPPPGTGQQWGTFTLASDKQRLSMFANQYEPPPAYTDLLTFGDPSTPSLVTNQSDLTLGMYVQPLPANSPYNNPIKRADTTYASIPPSAPGEGRVRGHPDSLSQNQRSTDPTGLEMDRERRAYTDESDSTRTANQGPPMGGVSSWREKEIERPAEANLQPFTQINVDPVGGSLGIANPELLYFRRPSGQGYDDIRIDNRHRKNYKKMWENAGERKGTAMRQYAYQTVLGRVDARNDPFPEMSVRRRGKDFDDPRRSTYPGYQSPPRSPYVALSGEDTFPESVPGKVRVGDRVMSDRRKVPCIVLEVSDYGNGYSACVLEEIGGGTSTFNDVLPGRLLEGQKVTASNGTECVVIGVHSYNDVAGTTTCTLRRIPPPKPSKWRYAPY